MFKGMLKSSTGKDRGGSSFGDCSTSSPSFWLLVTSSSSPPASAIVTSSSLSRPSPVSCEAEQEWQRGDRVVTSPGIGVTRNARTSSSGRDVHGAALLSEVKLRRLRNTFRGCRGIKV